MNNIYDFVDSEDDRAQNPLYPRDRMLTVAEVETQARLASFHRAQSPGLRVCQMDLSYIETEDPGEHLKSHSYDEYMEWRRSHINDATGAIIADTDPWTPWWTYDQFVEHMPARPWPYPPPGLEGWIARMRVVPDGIPQMDAQTGSLLGYTFVTRTPPIEDVQIVPGGVATRVTLNGSYQTVEAYISRAAAVDSFIALPPMFRLTAGGNPIFTVNGNTVCDTIPLGIDGSTGFLVTAFISAAPGTLGYRNVEPGWEARLHANGNFASQLDKSGAEWVPSLPVLSLLMVEGFYS
jgi:hypothetical protein